MSDNTLNYYNGIPTSLQYKRCGKRFVQFDLCHESEKKFVVFYALNFFAYIKEDKVIVIDGSFGSWYKFYQIPTIKAFAFGNLFLLFC